VSGQLNGGSPDYREGITSNEFWNQKADVFIPAAGSYLTTLETIEKLRHARVTVIACGANNPFGPEADFKQHLKTLMAADGSFSIIPDFIANCGTACLFSYFMEQERTGPAMSYEAICAQIDETITVAMEKLFYGFSGDTGLLNTAYTAFL
jgi:glutamate dehydrogenase (NAD(P)+)